MIKRHVFLAICLFAGVGGALGATPGQPMHDEPDALIAPVLGLSPVRVGAAADERVKWWRQARFGMFIHFGVYAIPGRGEWVMYNDDQVTRLRELGQWLQTYGSAIYDTRGGPFLPTATVTSTRRGKTVFVHLLPSQTGEWPQPVTLPALTGRTLQSARLLATRADVTWNTTASGEIQISIPSTLPASPTQVIELVYSDSIMTVEPLEISQAP